MPELHPLEVAPRPTDLTVGSYRYWRWELRDFWLIMERESDPEILERAYRAILTVAGMTEPAEKLEQVMLQGELAAATFRYQRACASALGLHRYAEET